MPPSSTGENHATTRAATDSIGVLDGGTVTTCASRLAAAAGSEGVHGVDAFVAAADAKVVFVFFLVVSMFPLLSQHPVKQRRTISHLHSLAKEEINEAHLLLDIGQATSFELRQSRLCDGVLLTPRFRRELPPALPSSATQARSAKSDFACHEKESSRMPPSFLPRSDGTQARFSASGA